MQWEPTEHFVNLRTIGGGKLKEQHMWPFYCCAIRQLHNVTQDVFAISRVLQKHGGRKEIMNPQICLVKANQDESTTNLMEVGVNETRYLAMWAMCDVRCINCTMRLGVYIYERGDPTAYCRWYG